MVGFLDDLIPNLENGLRSSANTPLGDLPTKLATDAVNAPGNFLAMLLGKSPTEILKPFDPKPPVPPQTTPKPGLTGLQTTAATAGVVLLAVIAAYFLYKRGK